MHNIGDAVWHWYFGTGTVIETEYHTGTPTDVRVDFLSLGAQWVASSELLPAPTTDEA